MADKNENHFDELVKKGYYILWLTKNKKPFALFHNGSHQFKDIHNDPLEDDSKEVLDGLSNGCKPTDFEEDLKYYQIQLIKRQNPNIRDNELFVKLNSNAKLNSDGSIDYDGSVLRYMLKYFIKNGKLTIKFNKVSIWFDCSNLKLISLDGCPKYVGDDFGCSNNKLTSLEGCPKYVNGFFDCSYNKITNLDYAPEKCIGLFIYHNPIEITDKTSKQFDYPIIDNKNF